VGLHHRSASDSIGVEEIVVLDNLLCLLVADRNNFNLGILVINSRDSSNAFVKNRAVVASALSVVVAH
jgi:hypothetical protein